MSFTVELYFLHLLPPSAHHVFYTRMKLSPHSSSGYTVHLESILTPWLFLHFVVTLINLYTIPNNDKAFLQMYKPPLEISRLHKYSELLLSTLLKHLWQWLQPCSHQDGESRCTAIFRSLQRLFDRVKVRALAGPHWDIQRLFPKPLLRCIGCVLSVVVLLEGKPSPQSEVLSALEQVFIKNLSVLCSVHHSLDPD